MVRNLALMVDVHISKKKQKIRKNELETEKEKK